MRLFILFLVFISNYSLAQVKYGEEIRSKYFETYVWSYSNDKYEYESGNWLSMRILPESDYYLVQFEDEEISKVWWEFSKRNDNENDTYITEAGNKLLFHYELQEIWLYSEPDQSKRYKSLIVFSKLEVD